MEDDVSSSSSTPPIHDQNAHLMMGQNENCQQRQNAGRSFKTTGRNGGDGQGLRRPFRQLTVGGCSSSAPTPSPSSTSLSSAERNCRKKSSSFLQKQKSSSAVLIGGGAGGGGKRIKCVLVGDSKIGKTALVRNFINGQITPNHVLTTEDIYVYHKSKENSEEKNVKGQEKKKNKKDEDVVLQICDTGGQEEMDRLRPLCYGQAQMIIICFSVMDPSSFANVTMKWLPEVKRHCMVTEDPENPLKLLLVGTQSDLRSNVNMLLKLMDDGLAPISETQALRLASKIGALKYVESSSVTGNNVNHIFDLAMTYGEGKLFPKQLPGFEMDTGLQGKILPNLTERKLLFWRKWRVRSKSSKMKRLILLPCLF